VSLIQQLRRILTARFDFVLTTTAACSSTVQAKQPTNLPVLATTEYGQLARGIALLDKILQFANTARDWCRCMCDNKLGVVTSEVRPNEVNSSKSLSQGFHKNFRTRITVLMYAPTKLILTARYDVQSNKVEYK